MLVVVTKMYVEYHCYVVSHYTSKRKLDVYCVLEL